MFSHILNLYSYPELIFICDVHLLQNVIVYWEIVKLCIKPERKVLYLYLLEISAPGA